MIANSVGAEKSPDPLFVARYSKYAAAAIAAATGLPIFLKFTGDVLTHLGYPTTIKMSITDAILVDLQVFLGALPATSHGEPVTQSLERLFFLPEAFSLADSVESPLVSVKFDRVIAEMRNAVSQSNGGISPAANAAVTSYVNTLSQLFGPHVEIQKGF